LRREGRFCHSVVHQAWASSGAGVGWRLAELLPLQDAQRLQLLQRDDPHQRLQALLDWMP